MAEARRARLLPVMSALREGVGLAANGLLDLLYPPCCLVCGARQPEPLCEVCRRAIRPVPPPFCDRCGVPIPADRLVCRACEMGPEPAFAWSQTLGQYEGTLRKAIHRLKYDYRTALAAPLGRLLAASLDQPPSPLLPPPDPEGRPAFDVVVPVPLHPARRRRRGFNQAELLARVVATERGWKLDAQGIRRVRRTRSQTELSPVERAANVQGAFAAQSALHFAGQRVLLIDDVLTTQATVAECARVARNAGAIRVCIAALARDL